MGKSILVTDKNFYKKLITLSIPIALQQLLTAGMNMMDTLMVGQLDEISLSAVSMASQTQLLFIFMSLGTGIGASIMFARYWGANDKLSIHKALTIAFRFVLCLALAYTLFMALCPRTIMGILTTEESVISAGMIYLKWSIPAYFLIGISTVCTVVLRNVGKVRMPLYISIISFAVNIFCNWVFIFGKLGAPKMGVAGAALGTIIARFIETAIIFVYVFFIDKVINFRFKDLFKPCKELFGEFIKITIPTIISDTLVGIGMILTSAVGGRISIAFMSGNSITSVVQQMTAIFSMSLSNSSQILIGNTLGEGRREDVRREGLTFMIVSVIVGIAVGIITTALTVPIVNSYNISQEAHDVAIQLMYGQAIFTVFMIPSCVITKGVLRGGGDTRFLMIAEVLFVWVVSLPLGYLGGVVWHWSPILVFLALRIDHLLKIIWCSYRFSTDKWIKKIKSVKDINS